MFASIMIPHNPANQHNILIATLVNDERCHLAYYDCKLILHFVSGSSLRKMISMTKLKTHITSANKRAYEKLLYGKGLCFITFLPSPNMCNKWEPQYFTQIV